MYLTPTNKQTVVFDTTDKSVTKIDTLGVHPNGKIYLAPANSATIGVIDTLTDTFSVIDISLLFPWGTTAETSYYTQHNNNKFYTAVLSEEGKVYFLPLYTPRMMVYDPSTGVFELILDTLPASNYGTDRPSSSFMQ